MPVQEKRTSGQVGQATGQSNQSSEKATMVRRSERIAANLAVREKVKSPANGHGV
jgi:hypothetical protein